MRGERWDIWKKDGGAGRRRGDAGMLASSRGGTWAWSRGLPTTGWAGSELLNLGASRQRRTSELQNLLTSKLLNLERVSAAPPGPNVANQ